MFSSIVSDEKRKVNIGVMIFIDIMADVTTTLSVSKKFHEWLKSKGSKGENYEDIIKKLLKQEFVSELKSVRGPSVVPSKYEDSILDLGRKNTKKEAIVVVKTIPKSIEPKKNKIQKPTAPKIHKESSKQKMVKKFKESKPAVTSKSDSESPNITKKSGSKQKTIGVNEKLKQHEYEKNLELQGLNIELELAKLSNDTEKVKKLSDSIAKLQES